MLLLVGTSQKIQIITSAAADIEYLASWVTNNAGTITPGGSGPAASITTAATTDNVVPVPGSGEQRNVTGLHLRNNHASNSCDVTIRATDGSNNCDLMKATLLPGEALTLDENGNWTHYDANGGIYPSTGNAATQSDMEAGTSTTLFVTPAAMKWHPGVAKFWGLFNVSGGTVAGWNVDAPSDNGTGDITVNITTDFSSASYCAGVTVEMTATTYGVANARTAHVRFGGQAAGTLRCDCIDGTATTQLVKDPTTWHILGFGDQ